MTDLQALKQSKDAKHQPGLLPVYNATYGIILMSVLHRGISWVPLTKNASTLALGDAEIVRALDLSSETLDRLRKDFASLLREDTFKVHTFLETWDMVGIPGFKGKVGFPLPNDLIIWLTSV